MASILDIFKHVQHQGDLGRASYERRETGSSLGRLLAGGDRKTEIANVAKYNPEAAVKFQGLMSNMDEGRLKRLGQHAAMFATAPAAVRQQMYPSMAQDANALGFPVPTQYSTDLDDMIIRFGQTFAGQAEVPAQQQYAQWLLSQVPEQDREQALGVLAGTRARPATGGFQQVKFTGADGRERLGVFNGRTGQIDLPDGTSYNPETGQTVPTQGGQFMGADGMPVQIDPSLPPFVQDQIRQSEVSGQPVPSTIGAPPQFVGRTPEDTAGAVTTAQERAEIDLLDDRGRIEADNARRKKEAELGAERAADAPKRIARYRQALSTAANVETSIDKALNLIGQTTTGFIGARARNFEGTDAYNLSAEVETIKANLGFDRLQEMRDNSPTGGALGQVAIQELIALQSTVANLDPNQSEEQLRSNLERIRDHYARWRAVVEQSLADEQGTGRRSGTSQTRGDVSGLSDDELLRALGQ